MLELKTQRLTIFQRSSKLMNLLKNALGGVEARVWPRSEKLSDTTTHISETLRQIILKTTPQADGRI
jgi:hypothetical protein